MIPDDPFIFNGSSAFSNFDDHEIRLRHLLQQVAMLTLEDSRHLLFVCPVCKHPWYKAGDHEYPRLTHEQLTFLGATLHTDIHSFHLLPRALCPICSTAYLGGMFSAQEYQQQKGYHFLWESASPGRIRLLAMVCRCEGLILEMLLQLSKEPLAESTRDMRSVLTWLETSPFPETIRAYTEEQCQQLARHCPPGSAADGRANVWHGYVWNTPCVPLGGDVLVSLAVALPPPALSPFASLLVSWSVLARAMRTVL
jgi:hypothetical protein